VDEDLSTLRILLRTLNHNVYRPRTLFTRVGPVTLQVPQTRDGSFSTDIFKRYRATPIHLAVTLSALLLAA
jgi:transposase-like protein